MEQPDVSAAHERWEWRRRVRSDPGRYRLYRYAVAFVGVALTLLGLLLGPIPGPGGIPLVLAGLAILASEFVWAARLLERTLHHVRSLRDRTARQPLWQRLTGSVVLLAVAFGGVWAGIALVGVPSWLPSPVLTLLVSVPGARVWGGPIQ